MQKQTSVKSDSVPCPAQRIDSELGAEPRNARRSSLARETTRMLAHVWIVALLLVQVPTASAGYYYCNSGWWLSGSDCYAYYGGQQYQSWVYSGYYGLKGTTSQTYCPAGKSPI
jgi:hypothetical protein